MKLIALTLQIYRSTVAYNLCACQHIFPLYTILASQLQPQKSEVLDLNSHFTFKTLN